MSIWSKVLGLKRDYPLQKTQNDKISSVIAKVAYEEYVKDQGSGQSFERMAKRGGFGEYEIITLLYCKILALEKEIN